MAYEDISRDFNLTSTGKGHQHRKADSFPLLKRSVTKPLPPLLKQEEHVRDFYLTTNGTTHNFKPKHPSLHNNIYKKAPGHWNVKYTEDTIAKIQAKPQRKALTMANQESEMKSQFTGRNPMSIDSMYSNSFQPPLYKQHHTKHPLQPLNPATTHGKGNLISDRGVFNYHGDMYLTTMRKEHRPFTKEEQDKYSKEKCATCWEHDGYWKSWEDGSKLNPLPLDSVPGEKGVMRDQMVFKFPTIIPRALKSMLVVPNTGMSSEVASNFKGVPKEHFQFPAPKPWDINTSTSSDATFTVPKMYNTEYQTIGSGRLQLV